jgi:SWI/SNF-related matrix-associated actin-dependent regulator of chromatin subfamily A3
MSSEEAKPTAIIVDSPAAGVVASNATGANNAEPTTKPSSASTASAVASLPTSFTVPSPIDLTQDDDEAFEENHEEESFQMMVPISNHPLQLSVVGIRYYRGVAHPGEYVQLVREPHNPFDRNAVRVDNLHGQKVGHIKKEQAAMLAPIMDHLSDSVKLDG